MHIHVVQDHSQGDHYIPLPSLYLLSESLLAFKAVCSGNSPAPKHFVKVITCKSHCRLLIHRQVVSPVQLFSVLFCICILVLSVFLSQSRNTRCVFVLPGFYSEVCRHSDGLRPRGLAIFIYEHPDPEEDPSKFLRTILQLESWRISTGCFIYVDWAFWHRETDILVQ